uniref:Uncharacterized protein n=1 Tax=Anguilla anguilla TaxID=7936 RepID=A0A0E9X6J3_ANGAN
MIVCFLWNAFCMYVRYVGMYATTYTRERPHKGLWLCMYVCVFSVCPRGSSGQKTAEFSAVPFPVYEPLPPFSFSSETTVN